MSAQEFNTAPVSRQSGVKIDISEAPDGVLSRVQITVNDDPAAAAAAADDAEPTEGEGATSAPPSPAAHPWNQFEFLLSDNTIRAS